jgi:hypothetical protein
MSRGGIQSQIVENSMVALGDNDFETGLINVAAGATIKRGVVLYRGAGGKFAPVTDTATQKPSAVNPADIENKGSAAADLSIRAIIAGRVRADLLTINGIVTTAEQNDMLRDYSIIPERQNDISRTS